MKLSYFRVWGFLEVEGLRRVKVNYFGGEVCLLVERFNYMLF